MEEKTVNCPQYGSQRNYKAGIRYTRTREIQRYLCRECAHRFTPKP